MEQAVLGVLGVGVVSGLVILGCLWLAKGAIGAALSRSVSTDIERLRSDLGLQLERVRHQLEREAVKADLMTKQRLEVYDKLFKALRLTGTVLIELVSTKPEPALHPNFHTISGQMDGQLTYVTEILAMDSLCMSDGVRDACWQLVKKMAAAYEPIASGCWSTVEDEDQLKFEEIKAAVEGIEALMRRELYGDSDIHPANGELEWRQER
jgi:hypothetical protein